MASPGNHFQLELRTLTPLPSIDQGFEIYIPKGLAALVGVKCVPDSPIGAFDSILEPVWITKQVIIATSSLELIREILFHRQPSRVISVGTTAAR